jgi:hypothetical protein
MMDQQGDLPHNNQSNWKNERLVCGEGRRRPKKGSESKFKQRSSNPRTETLASYHATIIEDRLEIDIIIGLIISLLLG